MPITKIDHPSETDNTATYQKKAFSTGLIYTGSEENGNIEQNASTFNQYTQQAQTNLAEHRENVDRYKIDIDDEVYKQFNQIIAYSDDPENEAYKIGCAIKYSEMLEIPLSDAYANVDTYNREYWKKDSTDYKGAFTSIVDMLTIGKNTVKQGQLGQELMNAEIAGNTELADAINRQLEAIDAENNAYADNGTPRNWITKAFQAGAQSLPYTAANATAALFGSFIGGAAGAITAGFGASTYLTAGQEYIEMRKKGIRPEIAKNVSLIDGAIQGGIEAGLDATVGVIFGAATKGLKHTAAGAISEKVTNAVSKKLHFGVGKKLATKWIANDITGVLMEGAEEVAQQATGDTSQNIAISFENKKRKEELQEALSALKGEYSEALEAELKEKYPQLDKMTLGEIVKDSANQFIGGCMGAITLGLVNTHLVASPLTALNVAAQEKANGKTTGEAIKNGIIAGLKDPFANIDEYLKIRDLSERVGSEELFKKTVKDSVVFDGMQDEEKAKVVKQIFEEGQKRAQEKKDHIAEDVTESRDIGDNAEASPTDETGERIGKEREYRTDKNELYTEDDTHIEQLDDGRERGRLLLGDPSRTHSLEEDGNRYGYIGYTIDGDMVTIDDFKMTAGRESLSKEFYTQFAEKFAGKNIVWNPQHETNKKLKDEIIKANPSGKANGLNYFNSTNEISDNKARIRIADTIRKNTNNWSDEQVAAGTALLTSAAKARGENLTDFVNNYFHNGQVITNKESDVSNIAQAAAQHGATMSNVLGATQLDRAGKAIIYIGEHGDFNTFSHELGHFFRKTCLDGELLENAEKEFGVDPTTHQWTTAQEEAFADGFTDYLRTGKAKTKGLEELFSKIAEFLADIFRGLQGKININDNLKAVYDSLLEDDGSGLSKAQRAVEVAKAKEKAEKKRQEKEAEQKRKAEEEANKPSKAEEAQEKAEKIASNFNATTAEKAQAARDSAEEKAKQMLFATEKKQRAVNAVSKLVGEYEERLNDVEKTFIEKKIKGCEKQTETVKNAKTGTEYTGSFYVYKNRTMTDGEKYLATVLASKGFTVYMVDETTGEGGRVDAIVNGIPVDFKDVGLGNSGIKTNYQQGMKKTHCKGIICRVEKAINYTVNDSAGNKISVPMGEAVSQWTKSSNNGILAVWIDEDEDLQVFDMQKIRACHNSKPRADHPSSAKDSTSKQSNKILQQKNSDVNSESANNDIFDTPELTEEEKEIAELAEQGILFQLVGEKGVENLMQHFTHIASTSHDIKERTYANTVKNTLAKIGVLNANGKLNKQSKLAENGRVNVNLFSFSKQGEALIKAAAGGFAGLNEEARAKIFALGGIKRDEKGQYIYKMPLKKLLMDANDTAGAGKYLFAAYPELENVNVRFNTLQKEDFKDSVKGGTFSWYNEGANTINIGQIKGTDFDTDFVKKQIATQIDVLIQKIEADAAKQEAVKEYYQKTGELLNGLLARNPNLDPQKIREELRANAVYKEAVKAAKNEYSAPVLFQIIGEMGAANLDASEEVHEGKTRLENLAIAKQMTAEGKDAKTIRLATGWEKGARKWRYEIGDNISIKKEKVQSTSTTILKRNYHKAEEHYNIYAYSTPEQKAITAKKIQNMVDMGFLPEGTTFETEKEKALKEYEKASEALKNRVIGGRLEDCIKAPELFAAYPQLKDYRLRYIDGTGEEDEITNGWTAGYLQDNTIYLHSAKDENDVSTLIHELQHAIQEIEGFSKGGNVEEFDEKGGLSAYEQYRRTAGEVEARNVQSRINMTPEERLATLLAATEDVRRADQIILDKASVSYCQSVEEQERIIAPNGNDFFGKFNEIQLQKLGLSHGGKILLQKGNERYGYSHILKHENDVKAYGYKDIKDFVFAVCNDFSKIGIANDTKDGNKTYVLIKHEEKNAKKHDYLFLEFKVSNNSNNDFIITSGGVFKERDKKYKIVYSVDPTQNLSAGEIGDSLVPVENTPLTEYREPTSSTNKSIQQQKAAVNSDTAENPLFQLIDSEEELFQEAKHYSSVNAFIQAMKAEQEEEKARKAKEEAENADENIDEFIEAEEQARAIKQIELDRLNREIEQAQQQAANPLDEEDAYEANFYLENLIAERNALLNTINAEETEDFTPDWIEDDSIVDEYYKSIWETAHIAKESEEYTDENIEQSLIDDGTKDPIEQTETEKDKQWYDFISTDEYALDEFLKEVAYITQIQPRDFERYGVQDEEENAVRENSERLGKRYEKELRHGAFRYGVLQALKSYDNYNKVDITDRQRKTILTLMKNNKRDYRDLYADFTNNGDFAVTAGYTNTDKLNIRIMSPDFNADDYTPEKRKDLADRLDFDDLKKELKDGTMKMELDTVQKLSDGYEKEIKELKEAQEAIKKQADERYEISKDEKRTLERLHKKELEKIEQREQAREVHKLKVKLLKEVTKKVRFDTVNFEQAQKIIAIQQLFTPQLKKFVSSFLNNQDPYLQEAVTKYKTSVDYRTKLNNLANRTGGGSGLRKVVKLFEYKPFNDWTESEKNLVSRYLPRTDWIKELDIEELEKRNKSVMRIDFQSEETQNMLSQILPPDLLTLLSNAKLKDWRLEDVEELAKIVDDLRREGREELRKKREVEIERTARMRSKIERELLSNGLHIDEDDTPEEKERKKKAIEKFKEKQLPKILGIGSATKGTAKANEEKQSALNRLLHGYGARNMKRVARELDNGESGINTNLLVNRENDCFNKEARAITERSEKIENALKVCNLSVSDLCKTVTVDFGEEQQQYTIDELLYFRAAAKDEKSYYAVCCGNMFDETVKAKYRESPQSHKAYLHLAQSKFKEVLKAADKAIQENPNLAIFADAIAQDYNEQYERMNEVCIKEFNTPMGRVDHYVPLVRLESNGDTNEMKVKADMLGITGSTANNNVDDGMRKQRVDISFANQKPVEIGLYKTWCNSLQRTEHFIAYSPYIRELHRVYTSRDSAKMKQLIENRYGKQMNSYIRDYINEIANPDVSSTLSDLDRVVRTFRGKTAPAYLGWKLSGIIKQACTSPFPYMQYASPTEYAKAVCDIMRHKEMQEAIKTKSAYMNSRVFDPIIDLLNEELLKEKKPLLAKYDEFIKLGMAGLEAVDWYCVAPGWLAVYRKTRANLMSEEAQKERYDKAYREAIEDFKADGMTEDELADWQIMEAKVRAKNAAEMSEAEIEEKAVEKADEIVRMTQPSNRLVDLSPMFKERGKGSEIARAFLQFTTSLNVIYQNIRYDMPNNIKLLTQHRLKGEAKKEAIKQIIGCFTGYILAGVLVGMVTEGLGNDGEDDDEKRKNKIKKALYFGTTQFTDAIPIFGQKATNISRRLITGEKGYNQDGTDLFPMLSKIGKGTEALTETQWDKALYNYWYAAGLATGIPISGLREAGYTIGIGDNDGKLRLYPQALIGRRAKPIDEKKEK